jgi:RNA polymerase subunit RPABC4/transcription elongation factor Spt4
MFSSLTDNLAPGPLKRARTTAMYMSVCVAALVVVGMLVNQWVPEPFWGYLRAIWIFSFCAYWVLLPWWVYLDAIWRRMEPLPWALLTLLTNVFGLVTYLVVRYSDPQACPQCGQYMPVGSKRCPYCGVEAQMSCPQCQAAIQPGWIYCPSCGAQISTQAAPVRPEPQVGTLRTVKVTGCVRDASSGAPISSAEVKVDSRTDAKSGVTDSTGAFVLDGLEPRPCVLAASAPGYAPQARAFTPRPGGSVQFCLYPSPEAPNKSE